MLRNTHQPFLDAQVALNTPHSGELWAFRDDGGQWIAYPSESEARAASFRENAPGPQRQADRITFGKLLRDWHPEGVADDGRRLSVRERP